MGEFFRSIPAAASSPYAFVAYVIAGLLFLFAGQRLAMAKLLLAKITSIPEGERHRALEIATGTVLPTHISPEQWIRHSRLRWTFLLLGSLLIVFLAVSTIAILNPTKAKLEDIKTTTQETAKETQAVVQEGTKATSEKIDKSTEEIVTTVQDAALGSEAQLHGLLMPANDPDPQYKCKGVPPGASKIFLGGILAWSDPNKQVTALSIDGQDIIVLTEESGGFFLSANLYREDRRSVAKIIRNKFEINPNNYFKLGPPDRHELNIFDKNDSRVLHVRFLNETTFIIEGVFYGPKRKKVEVTQNELIVNGSRISGSCLYVHGAAKTIYFRF